MLLTYSDVAHIPDKLSVFYSQAYESLFFKHDALKSGFQRERRSGLDIQDFARVFAAFCMQSYDTREFSFSQSRALEILDRGKRITQLAFEPRALLDDALQAVCLLVEEGLEITFAHRSFQEYFVARFINSCPTDMKSKLVKHIAPAAPSDAVMGLLHEMDPYVVEQYYILPAIEDLKRLIKVVRHLGVSHFLRYLKSVWATFSAGPADHISGGLAEPGLFFALRFARDHYTRGPGLLSKEQEEAVRSAIVGASDGEREGPRALVSRKSLTARSECVRVLFDLAGVWGAGFLRDVLAIESLIRQRHKDAQSSLEAILAGSRRR